MKPHLSKKPLLNIKQNTCPVYQQIGLQRLKNSLAYKKYLDQVRHYVSSPPLTKNSDYYKEPCLRFHQASSTILSNIFPTKLRQQVQPQIQIKQRTQVSSIIQKDPYLNEQCQNLTENRIKDQQLQNLIKNQQIMRCKESIFLQNHNYVKQNFQHGVDLTLLSKNFNEKVRRLARLENEQYQLSKNMHSKPIFNYNSSIKKISSCKNNKINYLNQRSLNKGEKLKECSYLKQKYFNQDIKSYQIKQDGWRKEKGQAIFNEIIRNYNKKIQKYGKLKQMMTQKRKEAILFNQYNRIAKKVKNQNILSYFVTKEAKLQKQDIKQSQEFYHFKQKISTEALKQLCQSSLKYVHELSIQKL